MPIRNQQDFLSKNPHEENRQRQQKYASANNNTNDTQSYHDDHPQQAMHDTEAKYHALKAYRKGRHAGGGAAEETEETAAAASNSSPESGGAQQSSSGGTSASDASSATNAAKAHHCHKYSAEYCNRVEDPSTLHHGPQASMQNRLLDICRVNVRCGGGAQSSLDTCPLDASMSASQRLGNCLVSPCGDRPETCDLQGRDFHDSGLRDCEQLLKEHSFRRAE